MNRVAAIAIAAILLAGPVTACASTVGGAPVLNRSSGSTSGSQPSAMEPSAVQHSITETRQAPTQPVVTVPPLSGPALATAPLSTPPPSTSASSGGHPTGRTTPGTRTGTSTPGTTAGTPRRSTAPGAHTTTALRPTTTGKTTPVAARATTNRATTRPTGHSSTSPSPQPPLPAEYRRVMGWTGSGRVVALSFDDGPGPYTNRVLDILKSAGVHATFCQIGEQVADYSSTERRIVAEGNVLCNHSWNHDEHMSKQPTAFIDSEMTRTQQAITAASGVTPAYYRAPGGDFGLPVKRAGARHRLLMFAWAVDTRDWSRPGVAAITAAAVNGATPGAIILLHDGGGDRSETLAALPGIIAGLKAKGYSFVTPPANPVR